jgi:hypothetical protein
MCVRLIYFVLGMYSDIVLKIGYFIFITYYIQFFIL